MTEGKHDPNNYRAMSVPFDSAEKANDSIRAFFAAVEEARKKHRMREVLVIVEVAIQYPGEEDEMFDEADARASAYFGNSSRAEGIAQYAAGFYEAQHVESRNRERKRGHKTYQERGK